MISLPPILAPGKQSTGAAEASTVVAQRPGRETTRSPIEVASSPARLPALQSGETVTAHITERLPDGKLAATIKGEAFVLSLPKGMSADGNALSLRVTAGPPLSFNLLDVLQDPATALRSSELARAVSAALQDDSSTALQTLSQPGRLPDLARGEVVTGRLAERLADGSAMVLIKNAVFNLKAPADGLLTKEPMLLRVGATSPLLQFDLLRLAALPDEKSAPVAFTSAGRYLNGLLDAATQSVARGSLTLLSDPAAPGAGEQLRQSVEKSGVFYESHQRAWVDGRLSLEELKLEPQARLLHEGRAGLSPELGQLVQKQLEVHEQKVLVFQGQAWPGQAVDWEIQREEIAEREANGELELPVWQTRLNLALPALGDVGARLRMVGKQVQVVFDADDAATAQLIEQYRSRLGSALEGAGLALASLLVKHGADDEA